MPGNLFFLSAWSQINPLLGANAAILCHNNGICCNSMTPKHWFNSFAFTDGRQYNNFHCCKQSGTLMRIFRTVSESHCFKLCRHCPA